MTKKIGKLLATLLGGALLIYSASRTLHFIGLTLPEDSKVLAYFGLAALDGGLVAWTLSYLHGSRGSWQRAVSMLMVIVDALGVVVMFSLDTLYSAGANGMTDALTPAQIHNAILGLSAVIGLNIIATVAHHMTDPDKLREQAEEEAFAKVEEATLKQIQTNADALAAQLAPTLAADWMTQTRARYMAFVGTGKIPTIDATAQDSEPAAPIMPIVAAQPAPAPKGEGVGEALAGLWAGIVGGAKRRNGNGRHYESAVPTVGEATATAKADAPTATATPPNPTDAPQI